MQCKYNLFWIKGAMADVLKLILSSVIVSQNDKKRFCYEKIF